MGVRGHEARRLLHLESDLDALELVAGHGQVRFRPVEHEVEEQSIAATALERLDDVVLVAECDQHILDRTVESEVFHGAGLGTNHVRVARRRDGQVEVLASPSVPSAIPLV